MVTERSVKNTCYTGNSISVPIKPGAAQRVLATIHSVKESIDDTYHWVGVVHRHLVHEYRAYRDNKGNQKEKEIHETERCERTETITHNTGTFAYVPSEPICSEGTTKTLANVKNF